MMNGSKTSELEELVMITLYNPNWKRNPLLKKKVKKMRKKLYSNKRRPKTKLGKLDTGTFTADVYKDLICQFYPKSEIQEALGWSRSKLDVWTKEKNLYKFQILREAGLMDEDEA